MRTFPALFPQPDEDFWDEYYDTSREMSPRMKRTYQDINGKMKTIEYVGHGPFVKWHSEHPKGSTTIWYDPEHDENLRIPDNAWGIFKIKFIDTEVEN